MGNVTITPVLGPLGLDQGRKDIIKVWVNITIGVPDGEVLTIVIDIKAVEPTYFINCLGTTVVKFGKEWVG